MIELKISADSAEGIYEQLRGMLERYDLRNGTVTPDLRDLSSPEITYKREGDVVTADCGTVTLSNEELEELNNLNAPAENAYTDLEGVPEGAEVTAVWVDGAELDAEGIPWDSRIHVDSKNKVKDGTWRLRKKLEPAYVESIKAELKACTTPAPVDTATQEAPEAQVAANPMVNHSQLLEQMVADFASGALSIFTVSNILLERGLSSLKDAEGKPELIQEIAKELGVI